MPKRWFSRLANQTMVLQSILSAKAILPRFRRVRSAFTTSPSNRAAATIGTSITQKRRRSNHYCVAGRGYYQEEGKPAIEMKPGDCINIPAEVKHWHGAASDSWFSHLAIEVPGEQTSNEWCEPVTDAWYDAVQKQ